MDTFLPARYAFLGEVKELQEAQDAGVIVLPVPFEKTSTYGGGAIKGPKEILRASHEVETFDSLLNAEPYKAAKGIATLKALPVVDCDGEALSRRVENIVRNWLSSGKRVVTLGGEHTSVVGAIKAHCDHFDNVTVLHLDAHSDLRPSYNDDPWNHACAMARVLDFCPRLVQAGIRSQAFEERNIIETHALPVFYADDIHQATEKNEDWIGNILQSLASKVYITLDCDVFDPSVIPATGTPEPDGLTWRQVDLLLQRVCQEREVVGFDINELAPIPGINYPQFTMAKLAYRLIGRMCCKY